MQFIIYRFQPDTHSEPYEQRFELTADKIYPGMMLLAALNALKEQDPSLTFRSSCREGVCGSDGMNVNGENRLSCITPLSTLREPVMIRPLPGLPVVRDLVVDMTLFYQHYEQIHPYLQAELTQPTQPFLQTPEQREQLDGRYECILCACCTTSCPSFWWNPDKFIGPAAALAASRFIFDSRDQAHDARLQQLNDTFGLFRCRNIQNCSASCPKGLNPSQAIVQLKHALLHQDKP